MRVLFYTAAALAASIASMASALRIEAGPDSQFVSTHVMHDFSQLYALEDKKPEDKKADDKKDVAAKCETCEKAKEAKRKDDLVQATLKKINQTNEGPNKMSPAEQTRQNILAKAKADAAADKKKELEDAINEERMKKEREDARAQRAKEMQQFEDQLSRIKRDAEEDVRMRLTALAKKEEDLTKRLQMVSQQLIEQEKQNQR